MAFSIYYNIEQLELLVRKVVDQQWKIKEINKDTLSDLPIGEIFSVEENESYLSIKQMIDDWLYKFELSNPVLYNSLQSLCEDIKHNPYFSEYKSISIPFDTLKNYARLVTNESAIFIWNDWVLEEEIKNKAQAKFNNRHYEDVVKDMGLFILQEIKKIYKEDTGKTMDGITLIEAAMSYDKNKPHKLPVICFNNLDGTNKEDEQEAYKKLFVGFVGLHRNYMLHLEHDIYISREECIEVLLSANRLYRKLKQRLNQNEIKINRILKSKTEQAAFDYYYVRNVINTTIWSNIEQRQTRNFVEKVSNLSISYTLHDKKICEIKLLKNSVKLYINVPISELVENELPLRDVSNIGRHVTSPTLIELSRQQEDRDRVFLVDYILQSLNYNR